MHEDRFDSVVRAVAGGAWREAMRLIVATLLTSPPPEAAIAFAGFTPAPPPDAVCPLT